MKLIRNILVLVTVIGFALTGWLVGHILRFFVPASQFQHPPTEKISPKIKNGFEFEFEDRHIVASANQPLVQIIKDSTVVQSFELSFCQGNIYNTSLLAKPTWSMVSWRERNKHRDFI